MCAAGAQYCFERRSSERLFRVSKAIVFERLRQEESHFGPQTLAFIASRNVVSPVSAPSTRRSGPWAPLDMAKTLLILVGYATWERKDLLQQAFALRGLLVQTLRDIGLEEEKPDLNGSTSRAAMWDHWVQRESARRTKLVSFAYINVHSITYNIHPLLWSSELHLRLPCLSQEWQASSAAQWVTLQRDTKEEQMPFQQALSILLQGTANQELVHPIPSPIGNYILLHALLQRIYVVRELSFPATSPATISDAEMQVISRALRAWTSLWQQTPESMLDPNNESGPIPFTSSALLVVAYNYDFTHSTTTPKLSVKSYQDQRFIQKEAMCSRIVDHPGAMQNKTYEFVLVNNQHKNCKTVQKSIAPIAKIQQPLPEVNTTAVIIPMSKTAQKNARRNDNLTAVNNKNQLFRAEFGTMQYCHLHVYVYINAFEDYYRDFFNGSNHLGVGYHPAKLTIIFSDHHDPRAFNVILLMEFLKRTPAMKFDVYTLDINGKVREEDKGKYDIVFGPLRFHITTKLAGKVDRVSFGRFNGKYHNQNGAFTLLHIHIKPEYAEDWMDDSKNGGNRHWAGSEWNQGKRVRPRSFPAWQERQNKTREWLDNAGVNDGLMGWNVKVQTSA
ncbi:hypothetical protein PtrEW7m1_007367 [Pyrenophora tritici-repentis]|nr:hypothetical protein PtrEW7m1_007367 [Pyrenophora tritici-repentis]